MSDMAVVCCACIKVEYCPRENSDGTKSERWACVSCGAEFRRRTWADDAPAPTLTETVRALGPMSSGMLASADPAPTVRSDFPTGTPTPSITTDNTPPAPLDDVAARMGVLVGGAKVDPRAPIVGKVDLTTRTEPSVCGAAPPPGYPDQSSCIEPPHGHWMAHRRRDGRTWQEPDPAPTEFKLPRYDKVFAEGTAWLDKQAEEDEWPDPSDFFEHPDTIRLLEAYRTIGIRRPVPGESHDYDIAAHNLAQLLVREAKRWRTQKEKGT